MVGASIKQYVFIHPCGWNIWEHYGNGQQIHAGAKYGVCNFGNLIVVRYVLGIRVNFQCVSVLLQEGEKREGSTEIFASAHWKTCCGATWWRCFWHACLEGLFAGPIQHLEKPNVLTKPLRKFVALHRAVLRLKMPKCGDDVGFTAEMMLQQKSEIICCRCTVTSFITALCLDRGVWHAAQICPKDAANTSYWFSANS